MKFFLLACIITVASGTPRWDESGQYRILDDDAVTIIEPPFKIEPADTEKATIEPVDPIWKTPYYYPYYRYYQALTEPALIKPSSEPLYTPNYEKLVDPGFSPLGYRYRTYQPFVYDFKLVKDIDA